MENNTFKLIDSIDLKTAIIWTIVISLITDLISKATTDVIAQPLAINDLFLLIVKICFYYILLKKTLKISDKEQNVKFTLFAGSALLLISQVVVLYDIHEAMHSWGMFASAIPTEEWGKFLQEKTYPKIMLFLILGKGIIMYFFYLLSKYAYPDLKQIIRFLGIWSIVCNWIISVIIVIVIFFLSADDAFQNMESATKWYVDIFWYIALLILYKKAGRRTDELKGEPKSLNGDIEE